MLLSYTIPCHKRETDLARALPSVVAALTAWWGAHTHTDAAKALQASLVPGLTVTADPQAVSTAVLTVALDPTNNVKAAP